MGLSDKLAERCTILGEHAVGLLTRLCAAEKGLQSEDSQRLITDKNIDTYFKQIGKKFPQIDQPKPQQDSFINNTRSNLFETLKGYYYVFVDILELHGAFFAFLSDVKRLQVEFNVEVNFGFTSRFLTLASDFMALMILFNRCETRKSIVSLFSLVHNRVKGASEPTYPKLAQFVGFHDNVFKSVPAQMSEFASVLGQALSSVHELINSRHASADVLRKSAHRQYTLSIVDKPSELKDPICGTKIYSTFYSVDEMLRWVSIGYLMIPGECEVGNAVFVITKALTDGFLVTLFRDKTLMVHEAFDKVMTTWKDARKLSKLKTTLTDLITNAAAECPAFHADKREFLRQQLQQLLLFVTDKPGLMGPKAAMLLTGMAMARDEILWFVRHIGFVPNKGKAKFRSDLMADERLPELIFLLGELRELLAKYSKLLAKYHIEYLVGSDIPIIQEALKNVRVGAEDAKMIKADMSLLALVDHKDIENKNNNFLGIRFDWLRLQASLSSKSSGDVFQQKEVVIFAQKMELAIFHTEFCDGIEQLLNRVADLPELWSFNANKNRVFLELFKKCLDTPGQMRYAIAFKCCSLMHEVAMEHVLLSQQWLPTNVAQELVDRSKKQRSNTGVAPGLESQAFSQDQVVTLRKRQIDLSGLCWTINRKTVLPVFNHVFSPREYLTEQLEDMLMKAHVELLPDSSSGNLVRPSVYLNKLHAFMAALRSLESYVNLDMSSVFSKALLIQTQSVDSKGQETVTKKYVNFYIKLLYKAMDDSICFSNSRRSFVSRSSELVKAEDFTDVNELRALCTVLGPYGIKQLTDELFGNVAKLLEDVKKTVNLNHECLDSIHKNLGDAAACNDSLKNLRELDEFTKRLTMIGVLLNFRGLLSEAMQAVLESRIPFIFHCIRDLQVYSEVPNYHVDQMAATSGIKCKKDPFLLAFLKNLNGGNKEENIRVWNQMLIMCVASLRGLCYHPKSNFIASLEANENNAHCISTAVVELSACLFGRDGPDSHIAAKQREFLQMAAICLLRLTSEKDAPKFRDAILIILDRVVEESPFLVADSLEQAVPYALMRCAYRE
eukprot:UC4_evm1s748